MTNCRTLRGSQIKVLILPTESCSPMLIWMELCYSWNCSTRKERLGLVEYLMPTQTIQLSFNWSVDPSRLSFGTSLSLTARMLAACHTRSDGY